MRMMLVLSLSVPLVAGAQSDNADEATGADESPAFGVAEKPAESSHIPKLELTPQILYQVLLAEIAGSRGNIQLAASAYTDLAKSTRDPRVAKRAAEIALYSRQPEIALEMSRLWVEIDPESPQARQMLVGLLLVAHRLAETSPHLAKLLELEGDQVGAGLMRLNRLLARYPDMNAVARLVDESTRPYERLAEAHFARAQAELNAKDDQRALAEIERAQALRPEWEQAVLFKAQTQLKSSHEQALLSLRRFLDVYPKAREVRLAYARTLVGEKRFEEARREYGVLLDANKDDQEAIYAVALLSLQLNDFAVAEREFKRLLELGFGDANMARLYLGQIAEDGKRIDEALQWYGKVAPGAQYLMAQVRVATLLAKQGRIEEGRKGLQQAAAANAGERVALVIAEAQLLNDAGRAGEAFLLLDGKLTEEPEQPDLLYESALLAEKIGRFDVLERNLRKLIAIKPDHAHAYNALGYSLADRKLNLDEAQQLIDKALALSPGDAFIIDSKGWLLYRRGDNGGAVDYLQKAYSLRPDPEIAAHLGEVLWALGRRAEAEKTWNEAIRANPGNEALTAAIKKFKP